MKKTLLFSSVLFATLAASGCATTYDHSGEGASIGGVMGALAGGIIGHQSDNAVGGALVGGLLGAAGGAIIGSTVEKPAPNYVYMPAEYFTVNVPNRHFAGYTAVTLRRTGSGYIGPQGEYYPQFPPIEQLRMIYGA